MDMGGMDSPSSSACKISMLWNWYTVDTCFLFSTWHVRSKGMFAGSVLGVFFLVIGIEFVRRAGREYDRKLIQAARLAAEGDSSVSVDATKDVVETCSTTIAFTPSFIQQIIRGFAYGTQFTAAFLVMLLGMYYNGYILFAIFLGQTTGFILFGRDTCTASIEHATSGHCC